MLNWALRDDPLFASIQRFGCLSQWVGGSIGKQVESVSQLSPEAVKQGGYKAVYAVLRCYFL